MARASTAIRDVLTHRPRPAAAGSVSAAEPTDVASVSADDRAVINRNTPFTELPEMLSPEEFQKYAGIGRSTVYDLLRRGDLPHVRLGRVIRIPKTALR